MKQWIKQRVLDKIPKLSEFLNTILIWIKKANICNLKLLKRIK